MSPDRHTGSRGSIEGFRTYLAIERGLAPKTVAVYARHVERFQGTDLPDVLAIRAFIASATSASSVIQRLAAVKAFARYSGDKALAVALEEIDRPKNRKGLPRPVADWRSRIAGEDLTTRAVVTFLATTGLRISEACAIRITLPVPDELRVLGKGNKERIVPLTKEARAALTALGGQLPGKPRAIQRRLSRLGFTPHQMRHTFATSLIAGGADVGDVQKLLGHASPATTMVYAAYGTERLRRVLGLDTKEKP